MYPCSTPVISVLPLMKQTGSITSRNICKQFFNFLVYILFSAVLLTTREFMWPCQQWSSNREHLQDAELWIQKDTGDGGRAKQSGWRIHQLEKCVRNLREYFEATDLGLFSQWRTRHERFIFLIKQVQMSQYLQFLKTLDICIKHK